MVVESEVLKAQKRVLSKFSLPMHSNGLVGYFAMKRQFLLLDIGSTQKTKILLEETINAQYFVFYIIFCIFHFFNNTVLPALHIFVYILDILYEGIQCFLFFLAG